MLHDQETPRIVGLLNYAAKYGGSRILMGQRPAALAREAMTCHVRAWSVHRESDVAAAKGKAPPSDPVGERCHYKASAIETQFRLRKGREYRLPLIIRAPVIGREIVPPCSGEIVTLHRSERSSIIMPSSSSPAIGQVFTSLSRHAGPGLLVLTIAASSHALKILHPRRYPVSY